MGITSKKQFNKGLYEQLKDSSYRHKYSSNSFNSKDLKKAFEDIFYRDYHNIFDKISPNAGIDLSNWLCKEVSSKLGIECPALIKKTNKVDIDNTYKNDRKIKVYTSEAGMQQFNKSLYAK